MRVVSGSAGGLRLEAPVGTDVRPTSDRVRGAIFNSLGSLDAVVDATVVDLFAGTGALGIEALSRGAAHCTFVEQHRDALALIRRNLDHCRLTDRATVVPGDALAVVGRLERVDLALADPPYAFDRWAELLGGLRAGVVVCESDRSVPLGAGWRLHREKHYAGTVVTIALAQPAS